MSLALKSLFVETITAPRDAAQQIIALGVSRKTSIMCVIFTICLTVISVSYTHLTLPTNREV